MHGLEVLPVRIPTGRVVLHSAKGDFDERHTAFDEAPGEQAALAEEIAAIGVADAACLLAQVECRASGGSHEANCPFIGGLMAAGRHSLMSSDEFAFHVLQEIDAGIELTRGDVVGIAHVLNTQALIIGVLALRIEAEVRHFADHQGCVLRTKEA